ncbi:BrnA antitoxin family protein [Skermanella sp. TT6]|uniref:BrnA antitoxin family protein n=1 Tax=Skermanella cutis TaxID=2775420 RepID=A0ABX7B5E9_9PROT|nr:BrnA antitoxin family protein [Skermanella sp. TT6]QQP89571.1 BrnA antitoxin family protein [Skermanella sp. TT6]
MSNDHTVRRSRAGLKSAKADWRGFDALTDRDIEAAVRDDPDAAPLVDESWFDQARFVAPPSKAAINIRLDKDVLDFFKSEGAGYQTRMNAVLRAYMEHERRKRRA